MISFNDYQEQAKTTRLPTADEGYIVLGLIGELGELYGTLAKAIRDGGPVYSSYLKKEIGDILWFISALCDDLDLSLEDVAQTNLDKLQSRKERNTLQGSGDDR